MPHTVSYVPPGCVLLPTKRGFPSLPPPPPPAGFYKDFSPPPPLSGHWGPMHVLCRPPSPLSPHTTPFLQQKNRKLICIRDPSTGQDITHEILHCSPPNTNLVTGFVNGDTSPAPMLVKNGSPPNYSWFEPPCRPEIYSSSAPCQQEVYRSSPPCLCFGNPMVPWPPCVCTPNGPIALAGSSRLQYSREFLLSLRFHRLSLRKPSGLPDLSWMFQNKSPSSPPLTEGGKDQPFSGWRPEKEKRCLVFRPRTRAVSMGDINNNNNRSIQF